MALATVTLVMPLGWWTGIPILGGIIFLTVMWLNPVYRFYRMAASCLAGGLSTVVVPTIQLSFKFGEHSLGAVAVGGPQAVVSVSLFLLAALCLYLDYCTQRDTGQAGKQPETPPSGTESKACGQIHLQETHVGDGGAGQIVDATGMAGGTVLTTHTQGMSGKEVTQLVDTILGHDRAPSSAEAESHDQIRRPGSTNGADPQGGVAICNLPPHNPDFTGREELLRELADSLSAGHTAITQTKAIHGLGGVGKSQLALQYAHLHAADYHIRWWVRAEEPEQLSTWIVSPLFAAVTAAWISEKSQVGGPLGHTVMVVLEP